MMMIVDGVGGQGTSWHRSRKTARAPLPTAIVIATVVKATESQHQLTMAAAGAWALLGAAQWRHLGRRRSLSGRACARQPRRLQQSPTSSCREVHAGWTSSDCRRDWGWPARTRLARRRPTRAVATSTRRTGTTTTTTTIRPPWRQHLPTTTTASTTNITSTSIQLRFRSAYDWRLSDWAQIENWSLMQRFKNEFFSFYNVISK